MAPFQDRTTPSGAPGGGSGPYDEMSRVLAALPRPRPVRMSRRGKIIAMVVLMVLLASVGIYAATGVVGQQAAGGQDVVASQFPVYAVSTIFILAFGIWHYLRRCPSLGSFRTYNKTVNQYINTYIIDPLSETPRLQ